MKEIMSRIRFVLCCAALLPVLPVQGQVEAGFFNIAHMVNGVQAVDWAVENGANGLEADLRFDSDGNPDRFRHGAPCDCSCGVLGVCLHLPLGCMNVEKADTLLNHIAGKSQVALLVIDSKVSGSDSNLSTMGKNVITFLDAQLFAKGYNGNVIVGMASTDTMDYLEAAAKQAGASPNAARYYFSIDQGGDDVVGTIQHLIMLDSSNRVYGTGISACSASQFFDAILLGNLNQKAGVVGTVYIWTIDKSASMQDYLRYGALGIMTNHPPRLNDIVQQQKLKLATPGSTIPMATSTSIVASLPSCDCDYHPGGCAVSKAAPPNTACKCTYKGAWTCGGSNVTCLDPSSPKCVMPDTSVQSCVLGGGDCEGYANATCDCDYHSGGCTISQAAPLNTACVCKYKGFWTCGGDVGSCKDFSSPFCIHPDTSLQSCQQGGGDCGGY